MFKSEPVDGVQSPFHTANDGAKAGALAAPRCRWCGRLPQRFGVFCSRDCADAEVQS